MHPPSLSNALSFPRSARFISVALLAFFLAEKSHVKKPRPHFPFKMSVFPLKIALPRSKRSSTRSSSPYMHVRSHPWLYTLSGDMPYSFSPSSLLFLLLPPSFLLHFTCLQPIFSRLAIFGPLRTIIYWIPHWIPHQLWNAAPSRLDSRTQITKNIRST